MHDPIVPVALRYATWLSSKLTAFRRLLHWMNSTNSAVVLDAAILTARSQYSTGLR
jgi:hypothetical protein